MLKIKKYAKFASLKTRGIYFADCSSNPQCRCRYSLYTILPTNLHHLTITHNNVMLV